MNGVHLLTRYSPAEERINIASHAAGLILSAGGLYFLIMRAIVHGDAWHVVSFAIYGISLVVLYASSTIYHSISDPDLRTKLRTVDHASIYILIAGTYTPFTLITLNGHVGWIIFAITWSMAAVGIFLKLFFTGRFNALSTTMYVLMGWIIIFAIEPLIDNMSREGMAWLVAGGIAYTLGAVLYSIKQLKFNHAIFHILVLAGSITHFMAVFYHVLPMP